VDAMADDPNRPQDKNELGKGSKKGFLKQILALILRLLIAAFFAALGAVSAMYLLEFLF
jgi:hypothetical protein